MRPKLPALNRTVAMVGAKGMKREAIIPIIRDQKHMSGSTNKLVNGATSEILLK